MNAQPPSCSKQRYSRQSTARRALVRIWRTSTSGRRLETDAYRCRKCLYWHLTSRPGVDEKGGGAR